MIEREKAYKDIGEQLGEAHGRLLDNMFREEKRMRDEDIDCVKSYRKRIKKVLAEINTSFSYRELSLAKTKLEEAEMWLSKLIKEGEK